jgi:hypothetical protein
MKHLIAVGVAATLLVVAAGCGQGPEPELEGSADREGRVELPLEEIEGVMRQKMEHAQALMAGLARADYGLVQDNATQLYRISQDAEWMVHENVTYSVHSDRFRQVAADMAEHARREDLESLIADYAQLVGVCVECHMYLRRERLTTDFPEKISMTGPADVLAGLDGPATGR